jgi:hypothetical protein
MLIYAKLCIYHRHTDGRTDKHIKSIVRNLTKRSIGENFWKSKFSVKNIENKRQIKQKRV